MLDKAIAIAATAGTLLWFDTMPWFDRIPFLLRLVIGVIVAVTTIGGMAMVRPSRRQP